MKKRILLPLLAVALPVQLAAIGGTIIGLSNGITNVLPKAAERPVTKQEMAQHANKLQAERDKLAGKSTKGMSSYEACLHNDKVLADMGIESGYECERVKNYRTPQQRLADAGGQSKLVRSCESYFRSSLKDPGSYRYEGSNVIATADNLQVKVRYTATNSFGGRIQDVQTCTFKG